MKAKQRKFKLAVQKMNVQVNAINGWWLKARCAQPKTQSETKKKEVLRLLCDNVMIRLCILVAASKTNTPLVQKFFEFPFMISHNQKF